MIIVLWCYMYCINSPFLCSCSFVYYTWCSFVFNHSNACPKAYLNLSSTLHAQKPTIHRSSFSKTVRSACKYTQSSSIENDRLLLEVHICKQVEHNIFWIILYNTTMRRGFLCMYLSLTSRCPPRAVFWALWRESIILRIYWKILKTAFLYSLSWWLNKM